MQTETLDKLYLEWSQITNAHTKRELESGALVEQLTHELGEMTKTLDKAGDLLELMTGDLKEARTIATEACALLAENGFETNYPPMPWDSDSRMNA